MDAAALKKEEDYVNFAKKVGEVLYEGKAPYHLPAFFNEIVRGIGKANTSAMDLKKIVDTVTVVYNAKVAEEKAAEKGAKKGKKASKAPMLAGGKAADARNNNPAMVNDLVGDYGDYGDYGDETPFERQAEGEHDFM